MRGLLLLSLVSLCAVALLGPGATAHPAGVPPGFTRLLHDCSDDWGPHGATGATQQGHDLSALDVQERTEGGKKMIVFSITMGDATPSDTTDKLEQLTFETPRKKGSAAIRTIVDTPQSESSSSGIEYVEGVRPAFMAAPLTAYEADRAVDTTRLRAELGYTYDQLQIQNNETVTKFWVKSIYLSTVGGARNDADRMPGSDYTQADPTTCATPGPDAFTAPAYKVTKSDWQVASSGGNTGGNTGGTENAAPVVDFSFLPATPSTRDTVAFTDKSVDGDGTIASWAWDFGDGAKATTKSPTHRFLDNGVYKVKLEVTDNGGSKASLEKEVSVRNLAPVAAIGLPVHADAEEGLTFSDASTDEDGTIVAWAWDFGDEGTSTEQSPVHTYAKAGTYTVTLKVTDDDGATHSTSAELEVEGHAEDAPALGFVFGLLAVARVLLARRRRA